MTTPTNIVLDDGSVVRLTADATGWFARHDGNLIHVSSVRSSPTATPAKARLVPAQ